MTVGQFVVEYGIPTLDKDNPKCHFQNSTDVTLFKMQLAEQGLATVPGFEIKLAEIVESDKLKPRSMRP